MLQCAMADRPGDSAAARGFARLAQFHVDCYNAWQSREDK
jgi:hypothetical protein